MARFIMRGQYGASAMPPPLHLIQLFQQPSLPFGMIAGRLHLGYGIRHAGRVILRHHLISDRRGTL
ncbi:hypothetical protein DTL00_12970 [Sphingomonas melonis]